jgi:hypothetical protein
LLGETSFLGFRGNVVRGIAIVPKNGRNNLKIFHNMTLTSTPFFADKFAFDLNATRYQKPQKM